MDALLASAGPLKPKRNRQRPPVDRHAGPHKSIDRGPDKESIDPTHNSILSSTRTPSSFHASFHASSLPSGSGSATIKPNASIRNIKDKKLRAKVARTDVASKRATEAREDVNEWLNSAMSGGQGGIEVDEDEGERTWRVGQDEIVKEVGVGSGAKKFDLKFEGMGEYMVDYTRNGRFLAMASSKGHVATFDWQAGKLNAEIQLREPVRDIKFLQSESFFAVAQKKYVFIYDQDGVELHKLKAHIDPTHMEYLPYHYLLSTVGHAGHLKYHDVSTGILLTQFPTHLGSPTSMAQNPHSAIIHLGHANGTMTLWSPNMTTPHVKLLAHRGPVTGIAVDGSEGSAGRYVATCGMEGRVKIWDGRMWGKEVRSWGVRNTPTSLSYSGRGMLAVGGKSGVTVYRDLTSSESSSELAKMPQPYLNLPLPSLSARSTKFCPYDDLLCVGHQRGISSLLVPGSGEANFDSNEADVYETYTRRRERDVRGVLEKIRPELITMNVNLLGTVAEDKGGETFAEREARSFRQLGRMERLRKEGQLGEGLGGEAPQSESEEDEADDVVEGRADKGKKKMRGRNKAMKRLMRKKKQNIIDPSLMAMKQKIAAQKKAETEKERRASKPPVTGALARFG